MDTPPAVVRPAVEVQSVRFHRGKVEVQCVHCTYAYDIASRQWYLRLALSQPVEESRVPWEVREAMKKKVIPRTK
jgi:hypothetical protein